MLNAPLHALPKSGSPRVCGRHLAALLLLLCLPLTGMAQSQAAEASLPVKRPAVDATPVQTSAVAGSVRDASGGLIPGAQVTISSEGLAEPQRTVSDALGEFVVAAVPEGIYTLTVASAGFLSSTTSGVAGRSSAAVEVTLAFASEHAQISVSASRMEIAAAQLSLEEKQRVLGVFPNFYATYLWNASPLSARQKFSLAWRFSVDPTAFAMAGVIAGTEQSSDGFNGYGQGMRGYARRFGATYTDGFASTMIGQAILPSIFRQDPRYFVKRTGTVRSRVLYAIATTVICKGDNGRWQANYSNILGNVASASLSNLYYPASSRNGIGLTVSNSLVTTASGAVGSLIQEFLLHRMTPNIPDYSALSHP